MNAGRDVERLIAGWLVEEAAPGAPDRILESTRQVVRRTNQRRLAAIWREPMFSPMRAVAMAAALVVALVGGVIVGRLTAPAGVGGPAPTPTAPVTESPGATIASYRAARNLICQAYFQQVKDQIALLDNIYDPALTAAERQPKVNALSRIATLSEQMANELDAIEVPLDMAAEEAIQLTSLRGTVALIRQAVQAVGDGDLAGAKALDLATDPNSRTIEAFESKYGLAPCP